MSFTVVKESFCVPVASLLLEEGALLHIDLTGANLRPRKIARQGLSNHVKSTPLAGQNLKIAARLQGNQPNKKNENE